MSTNTEDNKKQALDEKELDSVSGGFFQYGLEKKEEQKKDYTEISVTPSDRRAAALLTGNCPKCHGKLDDYVNHHNSMSPHSGTCHKCKVKWKLTLK